MKLLDSFTKKILNYIFNNKSFAFDILEEREYRKLDGILKSVGLTKEEFLQRSSFDKKEKINVILCLLKEGYSAYHLFKFINWKDFELLVKTLFEKHSFFVEQNFRFQNAGKTNEIDVLAFEFPYLFLLDCKFHKYDSPSSLKNAALKQKERALNFIEAFPFIADHLIKKLSLPPQRVIYVFPAIISWYQIEPKSAENVPIVPFRLLKGFIDEIDEIRENLFYLKLKVL